ncbi:hypothetical protein GCM10008959_21090 [Deinococcus seoulensis]|uniref:Extracellular solute-binding protein n=1 Tax=Deinococcus seoulensis TaxID=1837379 RepID=A0ABQ2RR12_9DEIO|nr:ABC transporter substrate-binding protein [Deinococcus seoulensis]GGR59049.1 hypothetical protein GCM10008959_21090 [Deinococcus seoulensis]
MRRVLTLAALTVSLTLSTANAQKPTLRIASISLEQAELYKTLETAFNKKYPQWTIKFEVQSEDALRKTLPLAFQSGDAPDLILYTFDTSLEQMKENGWLAPISGGKPIPASFKSRWPKNTFVNGTTMLGNQIYGVPVFDNTIFGPGYLFANNAVLRDAGINPATQMPRTWKQLLSVCEKVKQRGKSCFSASFTNPTQFQRFWIPFTATAGTQGDFNYTTGRFAYADPARLRAWDLLKTMYDQKYFIPGVETTTKEASRQAFALGQAAFYPDGSWIPSVLRSMGFAKLDYSVAPIPTPDGEPRGKLTKATLPVDLQVTSQVRNKDAAWAFVQWLTDPNGAFAKGYVGGGYGFVSFANNSKLIDPNDKIISRIVSIAKNNYRVATPAPQLACSDMGKSTAYRDALADTSLPNEMSSVVEALIKGQDWKPVAQTLAEGRQKLLTANLAAERKKGLNVSLDYFKYASWKPTTNFNFAQYPLCKP